MNTHMLNGRMNIGCRYVRVSTSQCEEQTTSSRSPASWTPSPSDTTQLSSHRSFKLIPVFVNLHLNTEAGFFWALKAAGCPSLRINRNIKLHVRRFTASLVTFYYCDGKISLNVQTLFVPAALLVVCIISWTRRLSPLVSLFFIFLGDLCASLIFLTAGLLQSSHYFKSALMGSMLWIPQAAFVPRYVIKAGTEH